MYQYSWLDQLTLQFMTGYVYDGGLLANLIVALSAAAGFYILHRAGDRARAIGADAGDGLVWAIHGAITVLGATLIATAVFYLWLSLGDTPEAGTATLYAALSLILYPGVLLVLLVRSGRRPIVFQAPKVAMPVLASFWVVALAVPAYRFAVLVHRVE